MAINKFRFTFEIEAKDLFEYISERNAGVEIQAFGTPPKEQKKQLTAHKTLALPPPTQPMEPGKRKMGAMNSLLIFLALHPKESMSTAGLRTMLMQQGYSGKTLSNAIWTLKNGGFARKSARGTYRVTAKGIREAEGLNNG